MATTPSEAPGPSKRAGQDQTSPIPLEFMVVSRRKRVSQDETSPIPLEFEIVSRGNRPSQDETSPFPLEFMVMLPDGDAALACGPRVQRTRGQALPRLKWRGINASAELREYAARVASGEVLPPYSGPILANGDIPWLAPPQLRPINTRQGRAVAKVVLGVLVMAAALVASALLGDDAELRAAGQAISGWFTGDESSFQAFPASPPGPVSAPSEAAAPAPAR